MQTPNEWPWDLELVFVNINKLICKLVEGLRFFKAEYNSTWWSKMDQKWIKNVQDRLKKPKPGWKWSNSEWTEVKKQYARFLAQIRHISFWIWWW